MLNFSFNAFIAHLLRWDGKQAIKSKAGAIMCCKENKITAPPNVCHNIPLVTCNHNLLKHFELSRVVKADQVHASFSAEVSSIKPIPILKLVPGLSPGQEVVMSSYLAMGHT